MKYLYTIVKTLFIIFIIGLGLISFVTFSLHPINKVLLYFFDINNNVLYVEAKEPLLKSKVKIEVLTMTGKNTIYNGDSKGGIVNQYGRYKFLITYDNKFYAKASHYRFNWHDQYRYSFSFEKKEDSIFLKVKFDGADGMEDLIKMKYK